jgi:hypothetical protein
MNEVLNLQQGVLRLRRQFSGRSLLYLAVLALAVNDAQGGRRWPHLGGSTYHCQLFRFDYGFHLVLGGAAGMNFSLPSTDIIVVWAMMKML